MGSWKFCKSNEKNSIRRKHERIDTRIGTICKIKEVCQEDDGTPYYGITPIDREDVPFYYLEKELEKGQIVWVPDAFYENKEQKGR